MDIEKMLEIIKTGDCVPKKKAEKAKCTLRNFKRTHDNAAPFSSSASN